MRGIDLGPFPSCGSNLGAGPWFPSKPHIPPGTRLGQRCADAQRRNDWRPGRQAPGATHRMPDVQSARPLLRRTACRGVRAHLSTHRLAERAHRRLSTKESGRRHGSLRRGHAGLGGATVSGWPIFVLASGPIFRDRQESTTWIAFPPERQRGPDRRILLPTPPTVGTVPLASCRPAVQTYPLINWGTVPSCPALAP